MPMQVILLEHVDNLGNLGDVVKVKPGYARNYLIPQSKALRATADNVAYFESQKKEIEKQNEIRRKEAEKDLKKLEKFTVSIIRLASEAGQLYGSVSARDIADAVAAKSGLKIERSMVTIHNAFKTIGLFPVSIALHPEVRIDVTVNIARTEEEASVQEKTGKALIADQMTAGESARATAEAELEAIAAKSKKELMEEEALSADLEMEQEEAERQAEEKAQRAEKSAKRAAKKTSADDAADAANDSAPEGDDA